MPACCACAGFVGEGLAVTVATWRERLLSHCEWLSLANLPCGRWATQSFDFVHAAVTGVAGSLATSALPHAFVARHRRGCESPANHSVDARTSTTAIVLSHNTAFTASAAAMSASSTLHFAAHATMSHKQPTLLCCTCNLGACLCHRLRAGTSVPVHKLREGL
jgi:hypothetical protein